MSENRLSLPAIEARGLYAAGLTDVSLRIARGAFATALGNGADVLVGVLAGRLPLRSGEVRAEGRLLVRTPAWKRGFGVVEHGTALFPHLSVGANIAFPLRVRGVRRAEAHPRVVRLLQDFGLTIVAGARPAELTPFQTRLACLARAVVFAPRILLLGNPGAELAPAEKRALLALVAGLHRAEGLTLLLATDDPAEALSFADGVAVFREGRLLQFGTPRAVYEDAASPQVADATGAINRIPGIVRMVADDVAEVGLATGAVVQALAAGVLTRGEACLVCVRPERIAVLGAEAEEIGEHAVAATLEIARYQGDYAELQMRLADGTPVTVYRPAAAGQGFAAGEAVALAWPAQHARAYPAG